MTDSEPTGEEREVGGSCCCSRSAWLCRHVTGSCPELQFVKRLEGLPSELAFKLLVLVCCDNATTRLELQDCKHALECREAELKDHRQLLRSEHQKHQQQVQDLVEEARDSR